MKKAAKISIIAVGCVLGAPIALFLIAYLILALIGACMYGEARSVREYACTIPETNSGLAAQGVTYSAEKDLYILTGYGSDNTTLLYLVRGKEYKRVRLEDADGGVLKGHAGGVTVTGDHVYVTNSSTLMLFSLEKLIECGDNGTSAGIEHIYNVDNNSSYVFSDDKYLYVGEFYREQNYKTPEHHHYTTPNGAENKAIVSRYALDGNGLLPQDEQQYPEFCISLPEFVQGFAEKDGVIMLSRSYGLINSFLDYHAKLGDDGATVTVKFKTAPDAAERNVPLYSLDETTLTRSLTLPSFSEDLAIVGDRVAVTNEASANKYFVGKLFAAHKVYTFPIYKD